MKVELSIGDVAITHCYDMDVSEYEDCGHLLFYDRGTIKQLINGLEMLLIENDEV